MSDIQIQTHDYKSPSREDIRTQIFNAKTTKPQSTLVSFMGSVVEVRQRTLGSILDAGTTDGEQQASIITALIESTFVPGTDEPVFEITDTDMLRSMPFNADIQRISTAVADLSSVDFLGKKVDSAKTSG